MGKGHYGQYTGNARHSKTPVTRSNYRASVADDAAHIHYLKEDINYDAKHGHSDENMTADEKHISKLAGDMKYDKKHHSPLNNHGKPHIAVDEFGTPVPAGFASDAPEFVGGRVLSDVNRAKQVTFSEGDELRDFDGNTFGGTSLPTHIAFDRHERGLPPSARGLGTTSSSGQITYTPQQRQQVINAVTSHNAPINDARRNLNAANYSQSEIDLYNEQQKNIGSNARFRRGPGQRDKNPRSITGRG